MQPQTPQKIHYQYSTSTEDAYFQRERFNHVHDTLQSIFLLAGSVITTLLLVRFLLALLGADTTNQLVGFIQTATTPLVLPFIGLFHYDHASLGSISFEGYTLVAALAYSLCFGGLAKLAGVSRY